MHGQGARAASLRIVPEPVLGTAPIIQGDPAMTSRRRSTLVSGLVLSLTLATAGSARAQFGFQGIPGQLPVSQYGLGYGSGTAPGITPFDGNSFGVFSGGYGVISAY